MPAESRVWRYATGSGGNWDVPFGFSSVAGDFSKAPDSVDEDRGQLFAGIDVIGDYVTEVNVTCPTGIRELEHAGDVRVSERIFEVITSKLG